MKRKLKDAFEYDLIYGKHVYCYLHNNNKLVKWIKRKMNKRYRKEGRKEIYEQLNGQGR